MIRQLSVGIDIAERYSSTVMVDDSLRALGEWPVDVGARDDSWTSKLTRLEGWWRTFMHAVSITWDPLGDPAPIFAMEDIHPFAVNPAPALRTSGAMLLKFSQNGMDVHLVKPSTWQRDLGYKKAKGSTSKGWAKERAARLGFDTESTGKAKVDARDAFLIATWAAQNLAPEPHRARARRAEGLDDAGASS